MLKSYSCLIIGLALHNLSARSQPDETEIFLPDPAVEKRDLMHLPFPGRWKPARGRQLLNPYRENVLISNHC
jgi:hypothetical protein